MCSTRQELFPWHIFLLLPFASLTPLSTYLEPSFCDRIRPPRSQVARKLTPLFPHLAHVPSHPKSRPPWGFPDPNMHLIRTTLRTQPTSSRTVVLPNILSFQRAVILKSVVLVVHHPLIWQLVCPTFGLDLQKKKADNFYIKIHSAYTCRANRKVVSSLLTNQI